MDETRPVYSLKAGQELMLIRRAKHELGSTASAVISVLLSLLREQAERGLPPTFPGIAVLTALSFEKKCTKRSIRALIDRGLISMNAANLGAGTPIGLPEDLDDWSPATRLRKSRVATRRQRRSPEQRTALEPAVLKLRRHVNPGELTDAQAALVARDLRAMGLYIRFGSGAVGREDERPTGETTAFDWVAGDILDECGQPVGFNPDKLDVYQLAGLWWWLVSWNRHQAGAKMYPPPDWERMTSGVASLLNRLSKRDAYVLMCDLARPEFLSVLNDRLLDEGIAGLPMPIDVLADNTVVAAALRMQARGGEWLKRELTQIEAERWGD